MECLEKSFNFTRSSQKIAELANQITEQQLSVTEVEISKKELEINIMNQQMDIVEAMSEDPAAQAANYKKVFGPCCEVPQVGCGCGNCSENSP